MFISILNNIFVLFFIIILGFVGRRKGLITDEGNRTLSGILMNITMPALMIISMQKDFDINLFKSSILILLISFIIHMIGYVLGLILTKVFNIENGKRGVWIFTLMFSNATYMGIPVIESIYGSDSIFYISMATVVFNLLSFTVGIRIIKGKTDDDIEIDYKSIFFNMPIIGTVIGFLLFSLSIKIPEPLFSGLKTIANITVPLSMLFIGASLAKNKIKDAFTGWKSYILVFFRLIVMPVIVYLILSLFIKDELLLGTLVLIHGMPAAAVTAIIAAEYGDSEGFASEMVFLTTIISIITIPIISLLLI